MYSAVENDTQCVPVCNRWRLKAGYHVERSGNSMSRGRILELKNNYGIIDTDAYKVEHEWIPFRIEKSMLEEKEGKQYIKYTDEVEFSLSQSQGVRDRDIKEATDIRFIGDEWKYQERIIENNAIQNIRKRLSEYNFYYPVLDDKEFVDWLEGNNFQPRMLEYLSPGIFTCKEIIKMQAGKHIDLDCIDAKFKIGLLFVIDRIDIEFRKNILSWITGIENAYKTYFNRIRIADDGHDVGAEVQYEWAEGHIRDVLVGAVIGFAPPRADVHRGSPSVCPHFIGGCSHRGATSAAGEQPGEDVDVLPLIGGVLVVALAFQNDTDSSLPFRRYNGRVVVLDKYPFILAFFADTLYVGLIAVVVPICSRVKRAGKNHVDGGRTPVVSSAGFQATLIHNPGYPHD